MLTAPPIYFLLHFNIQKLGTDGINLTQNYWRALHLQYTVIKLIKMFILFSVLRLTKPLTFVHYNALNILEFTVVIFQR